MDLKMYRNMLDSLNEGIYFVDSQRKIIFWNKGAEIITGFSSSEVTGTFCYDNILNHVDSMGNKLCNDGCPLHETIKDKKDRCANVYLHHKFGHRVPVQVKTMPLYDGMDSFIGSIEIFIDENKAFGSDMTKDELQVIAYTDSLSEIPNRRYAQLQLKKLRLELEESNSIYSIAMIDIDFFKKVNDKYGHDIGDEIIKVVAKTLRSSIRATDIASRWGGEEFLIIFPGLKKESLFKTLDKIRMLVENSIYRSSSFELGVTVSIGGATASLDKSNELILKESDFNLYRAKENGRNCVLVE